MANLDSWQYVWSADYQQLLTVRVCTLVQSCGGCIVWNGTRGMLTLPESHVTTVTPPLVSDGIQYNLKQADDFICKND